MGQFENKLLSADCDTIPWHWRWDRKMQNAAEPDSKTRPLTDAELTLTRWMLEHSTPEAKLFLPQLDRARATLWQCPCGCASFNFAVEGTPTSEDGIHPIADFLFGDDSNLSGIFVFETKGVLGGVEVYTLSADVSNLLPSPECLRPVVVHQTGPQSNSDLKSETP